jgi:hypothetical protein
MEVGTLANRPSSSTPIKGLSKSEAVNYLENELIPAFKKAKHTPGTKRIVKGMTEGLSDGFSTKKLKVTADQGLLKTGEYGKYTPGTNEVKIGLTGELEQDMASLAHEGTHWLDTMIDGAVPQKRGMPSWHELYAEARAFTVETEFVQLNKFTKVDTYYHRGADIKQFLGNIIHGYDLRRISDKEYKDVIRRLKAWDEFRGLDD